ncbi:MAG: exopolyphosphatase [Limnobacter sp.]|nr:exopolyphosphatase [Limnobacter sp.]
MPSDPQLIAAVDLGSSSFRMLVGRIDDSHAQTQIYAIDSLREPVRLGAGLGNDKMLDSPSQQSALEALRRFGERLRSFAPDQVRAVATNAVRVARNGAAFIEAAEQALGFEIDVISGAEEARLVYTGVAHLLPIGQGKRLVIDIGGGSTEFIVGQDYDPLALESLYIGCVSFYNQFFPEGQVSAKSFRQAELKARREVTVLRRQLTELGWNQAIGSSGTARALAELCIANGHTDHGINLKGLQAIREELLRCGHIHHFELAGIKPDKKANVPGGLAIMLAIFEELELTGMEVTEGALRQGLLYDLLGRKSHHDMRDTTATQFATRYRVGL